MPDPRQLLDRAATVATKAALRLTAQRSWPPFERAAARPAERQLRTLRSILAANSETDFGRRHRFDTIASVDELRRAVPVNTYEDLRRLIDDQEQTGAPMLTAERPVLYAQTSGTSGTPKHVPVTPTGLRRLARAQRLFASAVHRRTGMFAGRIVGIGSPAVEGYLPGGSPYGSASGLVYENMPAVVRRKYVLDPEVLAIADHDARYHVIAALCLAERRVTGVATANPSTLLRLRAVMVEHWPELVEAVATGRVAVAEQLTPEQRTVVARRLGGDRERASELARLERLALADIGFGHLWPDLAAITTWTGGSAGFALGALRPHLGPATLIVELGYAASEVRGTIGTDPITNLCAPLIDDNFYELVERSTREAAGDALGPDQFMDLHELEPGGQYYVFVTTRDGLYRYDMNDIVEVTGRFGATPCLAFVQKGRGVTNITGEKVTEHQVLQAMTGARQRLGITVEFFVLLADETSAAYQLYVEGPRDAGQITELGSQLDEGIGDFNVEYRSKRASGRLGAVRANLVRPGTGVGYRRHQVAAGQRDAQFKYVHVQHRAECSFDFDRWIDPAGGTAR
jgi:hypothetical protein